MNLTATPTRDGLIAILSTWFSRFRRIEKSARSSEQKIRGGERAQLTNLRARAESLRDDIEYIKPHVSLLSTRHRHFVGLCDNLIGSFIHMRLNRIQQDNDALPAARGAKGKG